MSEARLVGGSVASPPPIRILMLSSQVKGIALVELDQDGHRTQRLPMTPEILRNLSRQFSLMATELENGSLVSFWPHEGKREA